MGNIIINVGRQFGSGGYLVARSLGDKLGIPVYDRELISEAARRSGFSAELFASKDEKRSLFGMSGFIGTGRASFSGNYVNDDSIFKIQSDVIRMIADNGPAIFIGRCADYILRELGCIDVFITAPDEVRVKRISERLGISADEAESLMKKKDSGRESYYNYFTFGHWGVASNYDLCIDSSILGIEGTADFIIEFGRRSGKIAGGEK
ncbi:MAG: AAA family ATPase [Candidatus Cryptobacteroides sp.]